MPTRSIFCFLYKLDDLVIAHRTRIRINQNNFMTGRRDRLKEKHPEVWHEVARDAIVWIVEQYFHLPSPGGNYHEPFHLR